MINEEEARLSIGCLKIVHIEAQAEHCTKD